MLSYVTSESALLSPCIATLMAMDKTSLWSGQEGKVYSASSFQVRICCLVDYKLTYTSSVITRTRRSQINLNRTDVPFKFYRRQVFG